MTESMVHTRDYNTIKDQKPFKVTPSIDAVRVDSETITTPRVIKKEEFVKVWREFIQTAEDKKFHPGTYTKITQNSSYIVTLFDEIINKK